LPPRVAAHLETEAARAPDPSDPVFKTHDTHVIASARLSLLAAQAEAERHGTPAVVLSDAIEGKAKNVGLVHAALSREVALHGTPFGPPVVLLSGGETTAALRDDPGRGGRKTAFLLSFALAIDGVSGFAALAADTDGIDGSQDNAGAFADGTSAARMRAAGVDPLTAQAAQDPWGAFDAVGDLFVPGPTGTNVNDFRAILIRPQA
jgi:hydroxypyruvate reductase